MLGIVFAVAAAVALGCATVIQHRAAAAVPLQAGGSLKLSFRLLQTPSWLVGKALDMVALGFQTLALAHAGLASVQAVLVSGVAVSLGLEAALHRRAPDHRAIIGVLALIAGTALLVAVGRPSRGHGATAARHWLVAVVAVAVIIVVAVWVAAGASARLAGAALALATAACFALDAAFLKEVARGGGRAGHSAVLICFAGFMAAAIVGNVLVQRAFQLAPLAVTMPSLTAAEPLGGLALGALLFHEHLAATGVTRWIAAFGGLLLVAGAILAASTAAVAEAEPVVS
jgi:hypothetical protein